MITLEKYGSMYLAMNAAIANPTLQEQICAQHGITLAEWNEANTYYMSKMADLNDMGKTAMALSQYMVPKAEWDALQKTPPKDFVAQTIALYVSEYHIQLAEFVNGQLHVVLQMAVDSNPNDEFETKQIMGRVHMSVNEQSFSMYGGVKQVILERDKLVFHFDAEGKDMMKCDALTVGLQISATHYNLLKRTLAHMYQSHPVLQISSAPVAAQEVWNGVSYDLSWDTFELSDDFRVDLRPNVNQLPSLGKYNNHVVITYENNDNSVQYFEAFAHEIITNFESDYETIVAMKILLS